MKNEDLNPHDLNPLFCPDWSDTASNCAAALEALLSLDFAGLTDRAGASGVGMLLEPIIGALDGALALEAGCITLDPRETARLRALAMSRHNGDVRAAIAAALNLAEQPAPEPSPAEKLERRRWQAERFRAVADDLVREAEAELAASEQATAEPSTAEDADPGWSVDLALTDSEQQLLGDLAARAYRGDVEAAASALLSAALRSHAQAVMGGSA